MTNNLNVTVTAGLDKSKSVSQINQDIQKIQAQLKKLKLKAELDKGKSIAEIQKQIASLNKQKRNLYVDLKIRQKDLKKQYKQAVENIQRQALNVDISTSTAQNQMNSLTNSVRQTRSETVAFADSFKKAISNMGLVISAQTALQLVRKAADEATAAIKEYDKYATNLSIITVGSKESSYETIADLSEKSFDFKVDVSELEGAYETLLRTGKAAGELDNYLKSTVFLSKVGFEDMDTSAENLVTIGNAFKLQSDEIENVVSSLVALDTASNTVAGKLSTAMSKTAQNAQLAGLNIDQLGAIISGLRDTTGRSEDELATSLNGILTRLYNVKFGKYKIELEDGSTEDITESLNNVEDMLKTVGMNIRTSKGEFKDVADIIDELVSKWDKLNDVQKNAVGFTFAGTYHKNTFISLVENWERIKELTDISADSAGQASEKYNAYLDSVEAKSAALSTAVKDMWNNLIPNNLAGDLTEAATGVVQFTDKYQVLQTALKSAAFYALAKGIVTAKNGFVGMVTDIKNVSTSMDMASKISTLSAQEFAALKNVTSSLSDKQLKLVLSTNELTYADKLNIVQTGNLTKAEAEQKLSALGITQANTTATASTFSLSGAFKALWASIAANPIGVLTVAFTGLVTIYQTVKRKQEEQIEQAAESAEKINEQAKALDDLRQQYIDIVDSESDVTAKTEELNKWKQTLIETYGFEKEALENINLEREKGLGLLDDEINKNRINSAETWLTENKDAYEDAKKKLTSRNDSVENAVIPQSNVVTSVTKGFLDEFSDNFSDILKQFSISNPTNDNPLAQIKLKGNTLLEQYENLNEVLNEITSIKVTKGLNEAEEELYNSLLAKQKEYKKVVTDDIIEIYETGNKYTNSIKLFNFETDNGINFENVTQDTYKEFRDKFLKSLGYSSKTDNTTFSLDAEQVLLDMIPDLEKAYREAATKIEDSINTDINVTPNITFDYSTYSEQVDDIVKNVDKVQSALDNLNSGKTIDSKDITELASAFPDYSSKILSAANDTEKLKSVLTEIKNNAPRSLIDTLTGLNDLSEEDQQAVNGLITVLNNLNSITAVYSDTLSDLDTKQSLLSSIYKEMNNDGEISVSTYQKLISLGEDYADLVSIVNGKLNINTKELAELTKKKTSEELATLQLARAELLYNASVAAASGGDTSKYSPLIEQADKAIKAKRKEIELLKNYDYTGSDDTEDKNKKEFDKLYSEKQHQLEMNQITEEEYINWLDGAYKTYFSDLTKYQDEYNKYEEEVYKYRTDREQKLFDTKIDNLEKLADKSLENPSSEKDFDNASDYINTAISDTKQRIADIKSGKISGDEDDIKSLNDDLDTLKDKLEDIDKQKIEFEIDIITKKNDNLEREYDKTGNESLIDDMEKNLLDEKSTIQNEIQRLLDDEGYSENSDIVQEWVDKENGVNDELKDIYDRRVDIIKDSIDEQLDIVDREIEQTGDTKLYQVRINILTEGINDIEKQIDSYLEKGGYTEDSDTIKELRKKQTDLRDDIIDTNKDAVQAQVDAYNDAIQNEIDILNEYKDTQDDIFDEKIKALEEQKKALEEQTDELEAQKEIEEKKKALIDAQRNIYKSLRLVYDGNGNWVTKPSQEALDEVDKAKDDLDETLRKQEIDAIEKQITAIEDQQEAFDDGIDKQVKALNNSADKFEKTMNKSIEVRQLLDYELIKAIGGEELADSIKNAYDEAIKVYDSDDATLIADTTNAAEQTEKNQKTNENNDTSLSNDVKKGISDFLNDLRSGSFKSMDDYTDAFAQMRNVYNSMFSDTSAILDKTKMPEMSNSSYITNSTVNNNPTFSTTIQVNASGNADEIAQAVGDVVDAKIVKSFQVFYDGYYNGSSKTMYGSN